MGKTTLAVGICLVLILSAMTLKAQQEYIRVAKDVSQSPRSYFEIGKPSYELKPTSTDQTRVSWKVDITDKGSRYHTLEVHIRFFDDQHFRVFEDTVWRVFIPADKTVTVTHETFADAKTAKAIRTAEVSTRVRGKAKGQQKSEPTPKNSG